MILTVTANPAIDVQYSLKAFNLDTVNRVSEIRKTPGGKGLNVSKVIRYAGYDVEATGFLGGANGTWIKEQIQQEGIIDRFLPVTGETRNCIAILHDGKQTELLEAGPTIDSDAQKRFLDEFSQLVKSNVSVVAASGSLPVGCDSSFYGKLIEIANKNNIKFLLDTSGAVLEGALQYKPYMIKPNEEELAALVGMDIKTEKDVIQAMQQIQKSGISLIMVSMGKQGALALYENRLFKVSIPTVKALNAVGSGDSTVAGIAVGLHEGWSIEKTLRFACTLGTANAMEQATGYVTQENIDIIFPQTSVEEITILVK